MGCWAGWPSCAVGCERERDVHCVTALADELMHVWLLMFSLFGVMFMLC